MAMDVANMLEVEENLDTLIKLEGNYFIMDSEQLVSNPFQELQQDAVNDANSNSNNMKKNSSMTEKLTIVKNNVCENHFQMAKSSLERQRTSKLKQLHDHSNRLRHEVKLLDLDRQRHTVEVRKRMEPDKDHSYDEVQIHNTERRLGANIASFYLDKKLKYPTRLRSIKDIRVTPTISRARAKIRTSDVNRALLEEERTNAGSYSRQERAQTAKTSASSSSVVVAAAHHASAGSALRRRGSRSAPVYNARVTRSAGGGGGGGGGKTLFPAISTENNTKNDNGRRAAMLTRSKTFTNKGSVENESRGEPHQVKFAFENNPLKILASSEESANMFARSCSYYPGSTRAVNFGLDSSSDEDALSEPERIDLRAILFPTDDNNNNNNNNKSTTPAAGGLSASHSSLSQHQIWALRKAQGPAPKLTTTQKEEEASAMDSKINKFLEKLALARSKKRRRRRYNSDSESSEEDEEEEEGGGGSYNHNPDRSNQTTSFFQKTTATTTSTGTSTNNDNENNNNNNLNTTSKHSNTVGTNTESTTPRPIGGAVDNNNNNNNNNNAIPTINQPKIPPAPRTVHPMFHNDNNETTKHLTQQHQGSGGGGDTTNNPHPHSDQQQQQHNNNTPRKYSWRCIRGKPAHGDKLQDGRAYRTEDLVIQALTGVPISNAIRTHVPMHSASRAMRHTATFKMHKIVERLIHERTKYERHQVEEIKRQQLVETNSNSEPTETGVPLSRRVSKTAILTTQLSNI